MVHHLTETACSWFFHTFIHVTGNCLYYPGSLAVLALPDLTAAFDSADAILLHRCV